MTEIDPDKIFDAVYYAHGCGVPYERNEHWLRQFRAIAERIVVDIQPRTVFDAGCAMGLLVETLRDRGVEAYGVDISSFAISQIYAPIKPFCWVGSVGDALPQRYDLVVCIEVLEHMQQSDAEAAIVNLCQYCDDLLFSSSPDDYREVTHFNVQPPEYWSGIFARQGFYRDFDFDATFITPWAVRFRRGQDPFHQIVHGYERRYWRLSRENSDLRALSHELRGHTDASYQLILDLNRQLADRDQQLLDREQELHHYRNELNWSVRAYGYLRNELQGYIDRLQADLELKVNHIEELKAAIARLESGRVMQFLRRFERAPALSHTVPTDAVIEAPSADAYAHWITAHEPNAAELKAQRTQSSEFAYRPLISLITPVFDPPPDVLAQTLDSVRAQTYPHWQLCLVDGGSAHHRLRPLLEAYARDDSRINVRFLPQNLGISGNSNAALALAQGEFVLLFDHDDLLAPHALYELVRLLNDHADTDIIYYDEDKIDAAGQQRHSPWFKPTTWSPDTILATNILMHSAIRRALIAQVGGFDMRRDGAQDWDLALRCVEQTSRIRHLPMVLYHWRQIPGSAAAHVHAKPWALEAQSLSIVDHLRRSEGLQLQVAFPSAGTVQIVWPTMHLHVTVIIVVHDHATLLRHCLTTLRQVTRYPHYEVVLVDLGTTQPEIALLYAELAADPCYRVVRCAATTSFAAAANMAVRHATGERLVFLDASSEIFHPDWLHELLGWGDRTAIGVVGAKILYPDGTIKHAGMFPGLAGLQGRLFYGEPEPAYSSFGSSEWYRTCAAVSGEAMLLRREVFTQLGGFDEAYQGDWAAVDLCLRASAVGYRVVYTPFARLLSHRQLTTEESYADQLRAAMQLRPLLTTGIPFYNPNLSLATLQPRFAQPAEPQALTLLDQQLHQLGLLAGAQLHMVQVAPVASTTQVVLATPDLEWQEATVMLVQLAVWLQRYGRSVVLLTARGGALEADCAAADIPLRIEPQMLDDARVGYQLLQNAAAVVINQAASWRLVHAARAAGAPSLWWLHETASALAAFADNAPMHAVLATASCLVTPSALQVASVPAQVIPYGLHEPSPCDPPLPVRSDQRLVIVVPSSIVPHHGQDTLLRALGLLPKVLADQVEVYLAGRNGGDWAFGQTLKALAERLPNVTLCNALTPEQVSAYLAAADIVVLPARETTLPLSLLESMARGKAIIATSVGGMPATLRHTHEGLLCPPEDYHGLAQALALLIGDPALRQQLGLQARERFQREFTFAHFAQAVVAQLRQL
ncbi:MAG: glycosyltransferase [Candidatus Viridilinea halotolerans]|uniref:Glycosyltransferase n=1 Tax=Candidatus Viridilinea halotolerans TaxID=2491704 RepID=A0A426U039_9CHLR|nr:MAG: glycosyltransferase [Candidatus Viridilinea halotolerans]